MTFLAAGRLWLLAVPVGLAILSFLAWRRSNAHAVRFTNLELLDKVAPDRPGLRRLLPVGLVLSALALLGVGAARPVATVLVPSEEAIVMLLVDTSISMDADDVAPTRLDAAREAALEFIDGVPEEVQLGVISFSGDVRLLAPPGPDRAAAAAAIERLRLDEGTAIGDAIFEGLMVVEAAAATGVDGAVEPVDNATLVVLSDGETTMGRPDSEAVARAVELGVPVSTISFGTDAGRIIVPDGIVPVPVNDGALRTIAEQSGGEFFDAPSADDLRRIFDTIEAKVGRVEETREVADLFGIAALLLGAAGAGLGMWWFARIP